MQTHFFLTFGGWRWAWLAELHLEPIGTVQNLWYHGQMWALNDCLKRAHVPGWTLHVPSLGW